MKIEPKIVKKGWGREIWIHNDEEYCGKVLQFDKKWSKFSMHYHVAKKESWYISKGFFAYHYYDTVAGRKTYIQVGVGDCITIERGQPHQLIAMEDNSELFETSTQHFDEDSYRIEKGDVL